MFALKTCLFWLKTRHAYAPTLAIIFPRHIRIVCAVTIAILMVCAHVVQATHSVNYTGCLSNTRVHTTTRKAADKRPVIRWWAPRSTSARHSSASTRNIRKLSLSHFSQLWLLPVHSASSAAMLPRYRLAFDGREHFVFFSLDIRGSICSNVPWSVKLDCTTAIVSLEHTHLQLWAVKMFHFILDYNFHVSWQVLSLFVPMETGLNVLQHTDLVFLTS